MFGSDFLEVAVGLVLLFLIVSLICSAVAEAIEVFLKQRAGDLERGIREILDDRSGELLAKQFYEHPFISGLFSSDYNPAKLKGSRGRLRMPLAERRRLPTYIPSAHFATAVLDLVYRGPVKSGSDGKMKAPMSIETLKQSAEALPQENLRRAVLAAIDGAEGEMAAVKAQLQDWYDGTMDRVSGWYKRRTQSVLFITGFAVAAAMNIDTIEVAKRLYTDPGLREAAVAAAENPANSDSSFVELRRELATIGYPIGWAPMPQTQCTEADPCERTVLGSACLGYGLLIVRVGLGWLVTALACMLGAPFWFDLLNKIMVIRSTVKPHEKSPEEASEDRQAKTGRRVEIVVRQDGGAGQPAGG